MTNKISENFPLFLQGITGKRLLLFLALASLALLLTVCSCGWEIHGDDPTQHRRSVALNDTLSALKKNGNAEIPHKISWLPSYHKECQCEKPRIPHEKCLQLVVEVESLTAASKDVQALANVVRKIDASQPQLALKEVTVVLIPAVREPAYKGGVTPYAVDKHFKTGTPIIVKIGE